MRRWQLAHMTPGLWDDCHPFCLSESDLLVSVQGRGGWTLNSVGYLLGPGECACSSVVAGGGSL